MALILIQLSFTGRLLYTTGDTANAVRYFLGLLRESSVTKFVPPSGLMLNPNSTSVDATVPPPDRVYLEDFRVALRVGLSHLNYSTILISCVAFQDEREGPVGSGQRLIAASHQTLSGEKVTAASTRRCRSR